MAKESGVVRIGTQPVQVSPAVGNIFGMLLATRNAVSQGGTKEAVALVQESLDELVRIVAKDLGATEMAVWAGLKKFTPAVKMEKEVEYTVDPKMPDYL